MPARKKVESSEEAIAAQLREHARKPPPRAALLKRIGALLTKRNEGRKLSRFEEAELEAFTEGAEEQRGRGAQEQSPFPLFPSAPPLPTWVSSRDKLAAILGFHPNSWPRWIREFKDDPLIPKLKRANGDYHVATCREFIAKHNLVSGHGGIGGTPLAELEIEIKREILRQKRRENDVEDELLVPKSEVAPWIVAKASRDRARLLALERELPPKLHGLDQAEMAARLRPLFQELIEEFSKPPANAERETGNAEPSALSDVPRSALPVPSSKA